MEKNVILRLLLCLVLAAHTQAYTPEYDNNGELTLLIGDPSRNGKIDLADVVMVASDNLTYGGERRHI